MILCLFLLFLLFLRFLLFLLSTCLPTYRATYLPTQAEGVAGFGRCSWALPCPVSLSRSKRSKRSARLAIG
ncbi:hypothetical protein B0T17DRAFT_543001 [Bombardia bombarda]|uniref:Uncharacterized protein n=1 Tax=Bombardia bombarda TaxID=252184 RepID=A0AA39WD53_9PEZI|nr:hypothetical protein B0T17DRAFT_543001 [Bombardia bombarda]